MYHPIFLFVSLRYLWNFQALKFKKIVIFLSIIGISISTCLMIVINSIMNGFQHHFEKNILSFIPHVIITNQKNNISESKFPKEILKIRNIKKISSFIREEAIVKSLKEITIGEVIGIDTSNYTDVSDYNIKNILFKLRSEKNYAIIGKALSKQLHVNIGDKINLVVPYNMTSNFLRQFSRKFHFEIKDIFVTHNDVDYYQIFINKKKATKLFHYKKNYITGWRLWLKNPLSLNVQEIKKLSNHLRVIDWREKKGELFLVIQIEKYIMLFLCILIFLVSSLNIIITVTTYCIEKQKTILILKSQGLSSWKTILIFVTIGFLISLIGNFLGTMTSIILIKQKFFLKYCMNILFSDINVPIIIQPLDVLFINSISILLTISSILYVVLKTVQSTPNNILLHEQ
ncbi:ABC transporter permease [Buchnera aphidicola]|nr:ABC transporter permease [Buchnera aphidicola]